MLNPTNRREVNAWIKDKASDKLNRAVKRPLAAKEGIYSQYERLKEHVSSVHAARQALRISKSFEKHSGGAVRFCGLDIGATPQ
jgi:hypothetical protein